MKNIVIGFLISKFSVKFNLINNIIKDLFIFLNENLSFLLEINWSNTTIKTMY